MGVMTKVFGTHSDHEIKRILPLVKKIEDLRPQMQALTDDELKAKTLLALARETLAQMDFDTVLVAEHSPGGLTLLHILGAVPAGGAACPLPCSRIAACRLCGGPRGLPSSSTTRSERPPLSLSASLPRSRVAM